MIASLSGREKSRWCFGAMQFGGGADAGASEAMYRACRAAGITFFDTAHIYTDGESERILGRLIAAEREDVIVATKVAQDRPSTRETIRDSLNESLARLGTDYVDILYMHRWDSDTPITETVAGLAEVQESGKARHLGVSNYAAWQTVRAACLAEGLSTRIDIIQPMYNLVKRQAEVEILPMASHEGVAVAPYSPLGGGLLTGKYAGGGTGRLTESEMYRARYDVDWMHKAATRLSEIAAREGVHPATLAAAWVARHPAVTAPILSARSIDQLRPSLAAMNYALSDDLYEELAALSPAPPPATDRLEEA